MKFEKGFKFMDNLRDYEVIEFIEKYNMYRLHNFTDNKDCELMKEDQIQSYIDKIDIIKAKREKNRIASEERARVAQAEEEQEAKEKYEFEFCFGYCNNMTPMQRGKILKTLNIQTLYKGVFYTRKNFIKMLIEKGYTPDIKSYNEWVRGGEIKRRENKTGMSLNDKAFIDTTKIEYDYAKYLIDNKYVLPVSEAV
jgi:hypothetical protein